VSNAARAIAEERTDYVIAYFSDQEKHTKITPEQYEKIKGMINDHKFIEIRGELINVSDIRSITPRTYTACIVIEIPLLEE